MLQEQDNRSVVLDIIGTALKGESTRIQRREALKLRRKRRDEFLTMAEALLQARGEEAIIDGVKTWQTPPIKVENDTGSVNVRLVKCIYFSEEIIEKEVAIVIDVPEERRLFSVEQRFVSYRPKSPKRTLIRNHYNAVATNDQMLRGLQALEFIKKNTPPVDS